MWFKCLTIMLFNSRIMKHISLRKMAYDLQFGWTNSSLLQKISQRRESMLGERSVSIAKTNNLCRHDFIKLLNKKEHNVCIKNRPCDEPPKSIKQYP